MITELRLSNYLKYNTDIYFTNLTAASEFLAKKEGKKDFLNFLKLIFIEKTDVAFFCNKLW